MVNGQGLLFGLAVLSLLLRLGWRSFARQKLNNKLARTLVAGPWFKGPAIFFYFVGIPYLALLQGILTPRLLGLKGLEHFALVDWSADFLAVQLQQATTLMLLEWLLDSSALVLAGSAALLLFVALRISLTRHGIVLSLDRQSTLYTLYDGLHWAFYRAIFWSITADLYLGVVLGLGFVMLEGFLEAWLQRHWPEYKERFLTGTIILVLTAAIFFYSPNLWLLWPVHVMLVGLVKGRWKGMAGDDV